MYYKVQLLVCVQSVEYLNILLVLSSDRLHSSVFLWYLEQTDSNPTQHQVTGYYNRDRVRLLRGTN
jgi:hypothetical protein